MIKNFLDADEEQKESDDSSMFGDLNIEPVNTIRVPDHHDPFAASDFHIDPTPAVTSRSEKPIINNEPFGYTPPTAEESSRMSGLAFTAGIAFVSSVVFMLVLGWLVDTFIGTAPWGIVGGIVLGSIIGFIQFFRLNSQILNSAKHPKPTSFLDLNEKNPPVDIAAEMPPAQSDMNEPENPSTTL